MSAVKLVSGLAEPSREGQLFEQLRPRARHVVYERLAFVSAAIWAVGTAVLFIAIVPYTARPQPYIVVAMTIPILPAALPWLFYGRISDTLARRWAAEQAARPQQR